MRKTVAFSVVAAVLAALAVVASSASAGTVPTASALSAHRGAYWGGTRVTVTGINFTRVSKVLFGATRARQLHVVSPTRLTVVSPWHSKYSTVHVRVVTATGESPIASGNSFTFTRPGVNTPIMGGLTARQEQRISAQVRARHRTPRSAARAARWTPAMGLTALRRAESYLGLPYSWAGGNGRGPTTGVCSHNGGDVDCHVIGFDCSGLALYSWAPYKTLVHYAATQHARAGRFHPGIGELMPGDLVFFSGYIPGGIGHVAVYAGGGMIVEAAESGTVVHRALLTTTIADNGSYRGATRPTSTGRQGAVPVVSSTTTTTPASGGRLTINGRGLDSTLSVTIDGKVLYSFVKRSATQLVVAAPAHRAGTVTLGVSNAWGTVRRSLGYVAAPSVTSLSPATGPATGGTAVTISGAGLDKATGVTVGSVPVTFRRLSATSLQIVTAAHAAGVVTVTVTSPYGTSKPRTFTYVTAPLPTGTPTSGVPTTPSPGPGTSASTTSPPAAPSTTTAPTTPVPSTSAPSTAVPTTSAPTTSAPSTGVPSTGVPSTGVPSTTAPATSATTSTSSTAAGGSPAS